MKIIFPILLMMMLLTAAKPANNTKYPESISNVRLYKVFFSGLNVGSLIISYKENEEKYNIEISIRSHGIAKKATNYLCSAKSEIKKKSNNFIAERFDTTFRLRKNVRNITIKYDDSKNVIEHINFPKENPKKRPPIPQNLKDGAYDPLTVALVVRKKIKELRESGELEKQAVKFTLPLFDGRRRSDLKFTIHGRENQTIMEKDTKVIHLSFENIPVAGFTQNELRNLPKHNPLINVYVSDDDLMLPLKGDGETRIGWATGSMVRECSSIEDCGGKIEW